MSVYYCFMHFLIKGTFLTFFLRLSPNRKFRLWVGVGYGLNIGMLITTMFFIVFQCVPISAAWNTLARIKAQCVDQHFSVHGPGVVNTLLDIYVFVLPIPTLWNLQMPRRKKIAIMSVFAFGAGAVIMGLIRFHSLIALQRIFGTTSAIGEIMITAALELNLATIAVNLPSIRSIWVKKSAERGSKSARSSGNHSGSSKARSYTVSRGSKRATESRELSRISKSTTLPSSPRLTESQEELCKAEGMRKDGTESSVSPVGRDSLV
ncbi:hypothetical protein NX059_008158 [Plenodomus lindquistii]|nr:hypothetical protein NX059_008158 [Plenodomus lindquistii]